MKKKRARVKKPKYPLCPTCALPYGTMEKMKDYKILWNEFKQMLYLEDKKYLVGVMERMEDNNE